MQEIYFDNSATTKVDEQVIEAMVEVMRKDYGNPSSKHLKGVEAEAYLKQARKTISGILKVEEKEIIFTSGGTESNNLALIGAAEANRRAGMHIITTRFEHDSVLKVCAYLEKQGFEVTYLNVDAAGQIDHAQLASAIRPDTILVSVMYVNNEIGAVQDIAQIGTLIKEKNPKTIFHVDAVQAFGKYRISPKKENIDLLSVSGHKIHGPKGVGFLYANSKIKLHPILHGGGQQKGMRSGTDNVPGICGLQLASKLAYDHLEENTAHLLDLKNYLTQKLLEISKPGESDGCEEQVKFKLKIHSFAAPQMEYPSMRKKYEPYLNDTLSLKTKSDGWSIFTKQILPVSAPHIVSVTFDKVKSEVLLHALEEKGIYVSAGSACASNRNEISHTLTAIGLSKQEADATLRFSFSNENTREEIDYAVEQLKVLVPLLSRFVSK